MSSNVHASEALLFFTLLQLAIIVLAARAGGALAQHLGQAAVVGEILTGVLLGPSLFGAAFPQTFEWVFRSTPAEPLNILSQVGLLLLMFQIGLEFDFSHLADRAHRRIVWAVAGGGPGGAVRARRAAGAVDAARTDGHRQPLGLRAVRGHRVLDHRDAGARPHHDRIQADANGAWRDRHQRGGHQRCRRLADAGAGVGVERVGLRARRIRTAGRAAWRCSARRLVGAAAVAGGLRAQAASAHPAQAAQAGTLSATLMGVILACVFVAGMTTYQLGVFAIFGGFLMGVLLHGEHAFVRAWNARVGLFVSVFFLPVFFTYTGLRTDIGSLDDAQAWGWCVLLIALATVGKFAACALAARWAGIDTVRARILGVLMNTRGLMELIVINVGLEMGMIGRQVFTMLVLMALFSTVITSPALRRWLPRLQPQADAAQPAALGERS